MRGVVAPCALGLPPAGEEVSDEVIRAATKMYEQTKRPACPKSGVTGVTWSNTGNKWVARAARREFLGTFKDKEKLGVLRARPANVAADAEAWELATEVPCWKLSLQYPAMRSRSPRRRAH